MTPQELVDELCDAVDNDDMCYRSYLVGEVEDLCAENAKLRELVWDMGAAFIHGPCYRWCEFKEPCNGDKCQYRDRMSELGVEV